MANKFKICVQRNRDKLHPIQYELCLRISTLLADNLGREDRAMRVKCLSCRQEMNMDHQAFSNFRGSLNCLNCRGVMEIQTMRGVLIWGYPLSDVNSDFVARPSEQNLYAGQKKI